MKHLYYGTWKSTDDEIIISPDKILIDGKEWMIDQKYGRVIPNFHKEQMIFMGSLYDVPEKVGVYGSFVTTVGMSLKNSLSSKEENMTITILIVSGDKIILRNKEKDLIEYSKISDWESELNETINPYQLAISDVEDSFICPVLAFDTVWKVDKVLYNNGGYERTDLLGKELVIGGESGNPRSTKLKIMNEGTMEQFLAKSENQDYPSDLPFSTGELFDELDPQVKIYLDIIELKEGGENQKYYDETTLQDLGMTGDYVIHWSVVDRNAQELEILGVFGISQTEMILYQDDVYYHMSLISVPYDAWAYIGP